MMSGGSSFSDNVKGGRHMPTPLKYTSANAYPDYPIQYIVMDPKNQDLYEVS